MTARKPTPALKAFGSEVTRLREEAGISRAELARLATVSRSYISQVENGATRCRKDFAERLDEVLDTSTALADGWEDLLRTTPYPQFFADFPMAEGSAVLLRSYQETFVYGLFQIEEYMRALLTREADFEGRMRRQAILNSKSPPVISLVLGESTLYREVGGPDVMNAQLERLLEVSEWENVTLQVARTAHYRGISGSFTLATQENGDELLYQETTTGGMTSNDRADILFVVKVLTALQGRALSVADSREFIRKVASDRWMRT
ncbi:helix-turn-helix transcriptional regulator [Actinomadura fulvescens]|uniref:Helix-turn-helix transcriptional regulator n=1 Tax=Actinomadura fulvescens TaxID=46160 RepID=A0ABN3QLN3_9ACTN